MEDYENELYPAVSNLEGDLMEIEMMLQDALISATEIFKEKVSAINFHQREKTKIYIESCVLE